MGTTYLLRSFVDRIYDRLEKFAKEYEISANKCYLFSSTAYIGGTYIKNSDRVMLVTKSSSTITEERAYGFWDFSLRIIIGTPTGIKRLKRRRVIPGFGITFLEDRVIFRPVLLKKSDKKVTVTRRKDTQDVIYKSLLYATHKMKKFIIFYETPSEFEEIGKITF